jgi:Ca-activated chloride channel family protein
MHVRRILIAAFCGLVLALASRIARADGELLLATGAHAAFPLKHTDVDARVTGSVVSTTVTQTFGNPNKERIEAVYVFPLPEHAAVDDMEMHIGARVIRADLRKRDAARVAYQKAVAEGRHAALLEQERPNVFTFSVGNIDPGAEVRVRLHYFEEAAYDHGTYSLAFPTTVGPRYDPPQVRDAARISPKYTTRPSATLGVRVRLDPGVAIERVESPTHTLAVSRPSASRADVGLARESAVPNRDFVLRWRLVANACRTALFAYKPAGSDHGYLSVFLEPRHDPPDAEIAPREIFFLLDTSGSMSGTPLETVVAAVKKAVATLLPNDTFQIIDFADTASSFAPRPLLATAENRSRGWAYLDHLKASGGTNQLAGIHAALTAPGDDHRLRYVVFMTDGYIGNEREVADLTRKEIGRARIFSFGVGSSPNRYLLDEVAIAGRGAAEYLRPNEDATALVERFYERIGKPYLTDVTIDWGGIAVSDVEPARLPDLSAFEPLVVHARYTGCPSGTVTVRGKIGGRPYQQAFTVSLDDKDPERSPLERLWARARIAGLERTAQWEGSHEEEITKLALAHRLVTAYTSFVAIDSEVSGPAARALIAQPNAAPAGVDIEMSGGSYAGAKPQEAPGAGRVFDEAAPPRGGGCAGCTTSAAAVGGRGGLFALAMLLLLAGIRRR